MSATAEAIPLVLRLSLVGLDLDLLFPTGGREAYYHSRCRSSSYDG